MFAKLKKKVIEENGGQAASPMSTSRRDSGALAAVHSPLAKETPGGGAGTLKAAYSTERLAPSPVSSPATEDSGGRESALSKEELLALLTKRTEQCKKMEGNISDLAALIKDKNKTLEQLEAQNQQHEEVLHKRLSEQKAEFDAYRDKLIAGYQEDKLAMDKLILAQKELETLKKDLAEKTQLLTSTQAREKQLDGDLTRATTKLDAEEKECERLREDNRERAELVTSLTREKSVFEKRLDQLNSELTQKQNKVLEVSERLSELDSSYRALEHSAETHRAKEAQQTGAAHSLRKKKRKKKIQQDTKST